MLQGKKILIGITGSIAAYKSAVLVRLLCKAGAEVKVIMTPAAKDFIGELTLGTLSQNRVLYNLFDESDWANHVMLGRWADVMLIAPLSCNTLSKMASGLCDNLLMAVYLSATCPVVVAPAMDEDMWLHPATKKNLQTISAYGNSIIPVANGELASGLTGEGRMQEPAQIVAWLESFFGGNNVLKGKKILITAGPTYEAIDPVRFIGNHSSGKMGIALAEAFHNLGAIVTLVLGPVKEPIAARLNLNIIPVQTAEEMYDACVQAFPAADVAVMSAAVADYTPEIKQHQKIKKQEDVFSLKLIKTKDILHQLGQIKKPQQLLVGFALETNNEEENATKKLVTKNADFMVLNSLNDKGAGFGHDTNKITIFDREGNVYPFEVKSKKAAAMDIIHTLIKKLHA